MRAYELEDQDEAFEIIISGVPDEVVQSGGLMLTEGRWQASAVNNLFVRIDVADDRLNQKRHVHVANEKHVSAKNQQVAWNEDGTRHDKRSFNVKHGARANYQDAARAALGLPPTTILEAVQPDQAAESQLLLESDRNPAPPMFRYRESLVETSARILRKNRQARPK